MTRRLLRWLGTWLVALAFVALVIDGVRSLADQRLVVTPVGQAWEAIDAESLEASREAIETSAGPALWDPVAVGLLRLPVWSLALALGLVLLLAGRPKTRRDAFLDEMPLRRL
jgi:hypothetical protein